jgi:hypothetical protein
MIYLSRLMDTSLGLGGDVLRRTFYVTGGGLQSQRSHSPRSHTSREPSPREHTIFAALDPK